MASFRRGSLRRSLICSQPVRALPPPDRRPRFGSSLLLGTHTNVAGVIPCHPNQEKAQRILTTVDQFESIAALSFATGKNNYAHFAAWALIVIDLFSLITNTFDSEPLDREGPSLIEMWRDNPQPYKGVRVLMAFRRNPPLEADLIERRNRAFAHVDDSDDMATAKVDLRFSILQRSLSTSMSLLRPSSSLTHELVISLSTARQCRPVSCLS